MLRYINNGAMKDLYYWQLRYESYDACEYTTFFLSLRRYEVHGHISI